MVKYTQRLLIIGSILVFTSCATVFTGTKQNVMIKSNPEGATIEVDGFERGVTPMPVKLRKGFRGQTITLRKEGYVPFEFRPNTFYNFATIGNLINIFGWGIDAATGAFMKYDPAVYDIKMKEVVDKKQDAK